MNEAVDQSLPHKRSLWITSIVFLAVVGLLQYGWSEARGTWLERAVINQATVKTAVAVIDAMTPAVAAQAVGHSIKAPGGGINILNGCEGTEVLFLLIAGLIAHPFSWRLRALGTLAGSLYVFLLNQMRLLALFYAYQRDRLLFDQLHTLVAPLLLIVAVLAFFIWILRLEDVSKRRGASV